MNTSQYNKIAFCAWCAVFFKPEIIPFQQEIRVSKLHLVVSMSDQLMQSASEYFLAEGLIDEIQKGNHVLPPDQDSSEDSLTKNEHYNIPKRVILSTILRKISIKLF